MVDDNDDDEMQILCWLVLKVTTSSDKITKLATAMALDYLDFIYYETKMSQHTINEQILLVTNQE